MTTFDLRVLPLLVALFACNGGGETDTDADTNATIEPSVSAVIPSTVYTHRRLDVAISGYATSWTDTVVIDFGEGIDVIDYTVASPTAILVDIDVHRDAALGLRDVVVTQGADTTRYAGAFEVKAPLEVSVEGTFAQGSILVGEAIQSDPSTPFDATQTCDYFGCDYTNMAGIYDLAGLYTQFDLVGPRYSEFLVFVDVLSETGPTGMSIQSGPSFASDTSDVETLMTIDARTPKMLAEGSNGGTVTEAWGTEVWALDPGDAAFVNLNISTDDVEAEPWFALLDNTGSFVDGFIAYTDQYELEPVEGEGPYYLVVWDGYGDNDYAYTIDVDFRSPPAPVPDDTCATVASTTSMPIVEQAGNLDWFDDQDWFRVDVASGDLGKVLHVVTSPGADFADTLVDVYRGSSCTGLERLLQSDEDPILDPDWHEDVTTAPLDTAGTYYVVVKANEYFYDFAETAYVLDVTLEAP